ncbi:hypothetical protein RUM43_009812 [Polyplax serrata]|uniref:Uncharacterized protein n=1 Tax=Polyplax serrata TaxID=468196 RepID=A0AAN8S9V5_POLSC
MADNRRYIVVDKKKLRRHSAPEAPVLFIPRRRNQFTIENWCRASVSDFSTLFERQSESCSSLELDTSNLSADLTPVPTPKSSLVGSYMNLPGFEDIRCEVAAGNYSHCAIFGTWYLWKNLIFSQLVAACLAIMIICNDKIQEEKHPIINGQNLPQYVLLSILWTTQLALRNHGRDIVEIIRYSGLRYLCLSVLHVEINYLTLSSLRYGCSVGNQMIDCVAASLSLVIAYVLLEVQLHTTHILGFVIAVTSSLGFSLFIESDSKSHPGSEILLGNVLRIASGICLACNSVAQEMIVKATGCIEYLGMIGLIGSLICGLQVYDSNFLPSGTLEFVISASMWDALY